ncbi:MAG: zf-HC2 domain-containing protein [Pyrinomonadaceae bacterium]
MLRQHHVTARLSEYCHRQLDPERSRLVEAHLRTCARCRDLQDVQFGISLAGQLPRLSAPASIWEDIEAALDQKTSEAGNGKRLRG